MNKLENNYTNFSALDIAPGQKYIALRTSPTQGDDPLTWQQFDYNFELLRYTVNEVIDEFAVVRSEFTYDEEIASLQSQIEALSSGLNTTLGDYVLTTTLNTTLQNYVETADLQSYALKTDIIDSYTKQESDARYALISDIPDISSLESTGVTTLAQTIAVLDAGESVTISDNAEFDPVANAETLIPKVANDKMIFDYSDGALRVYDFNPSVPTSSSDDRHTLQLQRHTNRNTWGSATQPVGVSGQVNTALLAKCIVGPNVKSNEWAIVGVVENNPDPNNGFAHAESEHVGGYFQGKRHGSGGKTWGATIEAWDLADSYADVQVGQCVTVELDMTANFDAGANRVIVDGVLRKTNEDLDRPGVIAGMRLRDNHEDGSGGFFYNGYEFKGATKISAFSAEIVGDNSDDGVNPWGNSAYRALGTTFAHFQSQGTPTFSFRDVSSASVGIGLDEATYSSAAIRIGADQKFAMEATGVVHQKYSNDAIEFHGFAGPTSSKKFEIVTSATVESSRGPVIDASNANIEVIASHNVMALRQAIERALCDPTNVIAEQDFTGVVKLPAGRIYLNEKIIITMPGTYGHNLPNSLTIQGEGMGNSQLCWTNGSSSKGMLVELGPYGATSSQKVTIKDVDFILGNQGFDVNGNPVGVPASSAEGALGAQGIALEINGDRAEVTVSNPHATFDKLQGLGLKPSCLIENCNFMGWHYIHAGWDKCVLIEDAQITDVRSCNFVSHVGGASDQSQWWASTSGIHITGDAKCTDYYLNQNRFFGFRYGILCDGNIEGVTCLQSTWVHSQHGIYWNVQEVTGGQAAFDGQTGTFTSGSVDGVANTNVAQWPLLVVTDCHMNCNEHNIYIQNGWQIMIKGCSFYGINNQAVYGSAQPNMMHRSIYIEKQSSNVLIHGNTFSDAIGNDDNNLDSGGWGPSIEINGHACMVANNTFTLDPTRHAGGLASDEPMVKLGATASANVVHGNMATTNLDAGANQQNGILQTHWNGQYLEFTYEDNNPGTTLVPNKILNNF